MPDEIAPQGQPLTPTANPTVDAILAQAPATPAQAPAPAPTPATEVPAVTPAPTPEPVKEDIKEPVSVDTSEYTPIQGLTMNFLAKYGLGEKALEQAFVNVNAYGDMNLLDTSVLGNKATPEDIAQFKSLAAAVHQEQQALVNKAVNDAYQIAGGKENLDKAVSVFNTKAPDYVRQAVGALIDQGKTKEATSYIMSFVRDNGLVDQVSGQRMQGGSPAPTTGISYASYQTELAKITREAGTASLNTGIYAERIAALDARRALGRKQGI